MEKFGKSIDEQTKKQVQKTDSLHSFSFCEMKSFKNEMKRQRI